MMTMEPPRTLGGNAGKIGQVSDAEVWRAWGLSRSGLSRFLHTAQAAVGLAGEVEVLLAGDRTLRRLNRTYRGKDKATDVLSFPALEELAGEHGGDLAISLDTAKRQAAEYGHTLRDEVRVLLLHGLLHLSGLDHEVDGGEMAEREGELRGRLGLPNGLIARVEGRAKLEKRRSRFPEGMTERKAKAEAKAKEEADPCGMTARKTKAKATDAKGAKFRRKGRKVKRWSGVGA
jgi:probable rRNA maturation factor